MNTKIKYIILIAIMGLMNLYNLAAQDTKKKTTRIRVEYLKDYNLRENVVATLRIREDRYLPHKNVDIDFFNVSDTTRTFLKTISTDEDGVARYTIDSQQDIFIDSVGYITFEVEYNGDSSSEPAQDNISVKRSDLKVSFLQEDTVKYIAVNANEIGPDGSTIPIEGIDILFNIKGTFSNLKLGEKETDENGISMIEFPVDMPGDTAGVLTILAKIEESDTYGTIESTGMMNWGRPVPLPKEKQRGLGDTDAPLWMVYTLIVLLSAVWFHYSYVIFSMIKIKFLKRSIGTS